MKLRDWDTLAAVVCLACWTILSRQDEHPHLCLGLLAVALYLSWRRT